MSVRPSACRTEEGARETGKGLVARTWRRSKAVGEGSLGSRGLMSGSVRKAAEKVESISAGRRGLQACPFMKFVLGTNFVKVQKTAPKKSRKTVLSEICAQDNFFLSWEHFFCAHAFRAAISARFAKK